MATLAGGFLPFILRTFMQPSKPEIELGTVSFKSKLDEIIINFHQQWAMYDFPFALKTDEDDAPTGAASEDENANRQTETLMDDATEGVADTCPVFLDYETDETSYVTVHRTRSTSQSASSKQRASRASRAKRKTENAPTRANSDVTCGGDVSEVDIVIYMPEDSSDCWLDEWSDISEYDDKAREAVVLQMHVV